jgi:hypothetical protein
MFSDILNSVLIHESTVKAAIEWVEYELNRIYGKKVPVPSLDGEAERMLSDRLGKKWKMNHKVKVNINIIGNGKKYISVNIKKWN